MTIESRFNSHCRRCGGEIRRGQLADWDRALGVSHTNCPTEPSPEFAILIATGLIDAVTVRYLTSIDGEYGSPLGLDLVEDALRLRWEIELSDEYQAGAGCPGEIHCGRPDHVDSPNCSCHPNCNHQAGTGSGAVVGVTAREHTSFSKRDVSRDKIAGVPRLSLIELAEQCIRGSN